MTSGEKTADILSALSVDNIPERYGFTAELASLKNCISEDEYCNMEFYQTGCAFESFTENPAETCKPTPRIRCCP
ncbi:hypothetical protein ACLB1Q_35665 [Escherichia coli]